MMVGIDAVHRDASNYATDRHGIHCSTVWDVTCVMTLAPALYIYELARFWIKLGIASRPSFLQIKELGGSQL